MKPIVQHLRDGLWISLIVTVALLVAGASFVAVQKLPEPIVRWMLDTDVRTQAEVWKKRVLSQMSQGAESFVTQDISVEDIAYLSLIPKSSDIYRLNLISAEGRVFWSTNPKKLNQTVTDSFYKSIVANGTIYLESVQKRPANIDGLSIHALDTSNTKMHRVFEVYTPVFKDGEFVGTIEFYKDVTEVHQVLLQRVKQGILIAALLLSALISLATLLSLRVSHRQMLRIRRRNLDERGLLENQMQLAREVKLLGELNEWLQSSRSIEELFQMVSKFMCHMLPECEGTIYVYSNSRDVLDGSAAWNGGKFKNHIHPEACWGLRRGRTYTYGTSDVSFICEHAEPHDDSAYFCFPILAHGETVGLMHLKQKQGFDTDTFFGTQKLAQMSAEQISMAIANVRMRDQLQEQSIRDPLTGLFNRRHMLDRSRRLLKQYGQHREPVHFIYIDIDHFKIFNDNHGHDAGDIVLRTVGEALSSACDGEELACRLGGEEFLLVWPSLSDQELRQRAEKLRLLVENLSVQYRENRLPKITVSIGIASSPADGSLCQDLLCAADRALYKAKDQGRNQICFSQNNKFNAAGSEIIAVSAAPKCAGE
ncbi:MAG: sensor domain-containing diguanylate cyclase [Cognatishimia sp.]